MNDVVSLWPKLCVVVNAAIENKVSRLQLFKLQSDWKSVKLIGLIPSVKVEAKIFPHVIGYLSQKGTAIKEHRSIIQRFSRVKVSLGVWYTKIFFGCFKELFS